MNSELSSEIFCLQYELKTLAGVTLRSESERWIPGFHNRLVEKSHLDRYDLACKYVKDKLILDLACGVGRGSYLLAQKGEANFVTGYDIENEAIRYASHRNKHKNVIFSVENAETYSNNNHFDVVVSFETIEHLKNYENFIESIYNSLKTKGLLIISTPISQKAFDNNPLNPYHVQEWGFIEFQTFLSKRFIIKEKYVQLYPRTNSYNSILSKVLRKILTIINKKREVLQSVTNYSVIEKYQDQYPIDELGKNRIGYQIIIAEKE